MQILVTLIVTLADVLSIIIVAEALLSWFLPPFHPIRETLGRILQPIYSPIRQVIPAIGGIDITPIVALLLIQLIQQLAVTVLR